MAYKEIDLLPARAFRARFGRLETLEGGGKGGADAPDYGPLAKASEEAARIGAELGREQLAENRRQYENNMLIAEPIIKAQTGLMQQTIDQGNDYYSYMRDTFRPVEGQMVREAQAAGNADEQAAAAGKAGADVTQAFAGQRAAMARDMARSGVDPSSGRFASGLRSMAAQEALASAGAQTKAREGAKALGYAKRMDAVGIGRGLPAASQGAYGVALNAGNSAVGNQMNPSQAFMGNMNAGNGLIMQGQGMKMSGLSNIMNSQTSVYGQQMAANAQGAAGLGSLVGIGLATAGGPGGWISALKG